MSERGDFFKTLLKQIPYGTKIVVQFTKSPENYGCYAVGTLHKEGDEIYIQNQKLYLENDATRDDKTTYQQQLTLNVLEQNSGLKFGTNIRYENIKNIYTDEIRSEDQKNNILNNFPSTEHHIASHWLPDNNAIYIPGKNLSLETENITASKKGPTARVTDGDKILQSREKYTFQRADTENKPFEEEAYSNFSYKKRRSDEGHNTTNKRRKEEKIPNNRGGKKSKKSKTQRKNKKSNKSKKNKNQHK